MVHQKRRPLLQENPYISRLYPYRNNGFSRTYVAASLAGKRYQSLVVLHANDDLIKLMPHLRYDRAVNIQGWQDPKLRLEALPRNPKVHAVDERLRLAQWAGAEIQPQDRFMRMFLRPEEGEYAEGWLRKLGMRPDRLRVGLGVGGFGPVPPMAGRAFRQGRRGVILKRRGGDPYRRRQRARPGPAG